MKFKILFQEISKNLEKLDNIYNIWCMITKNAPINQIKKIICGGL